MNGQEPQKQTRGFASKSPKRQREIVSQGGRAAYKSRTAYKWNTEQAREAGRKGGQASRKKKLP